VRSSFQKFFFVFWFDVVPVYFDVFIAVRSALFVKEAQSMEDLVGHCLFVNTATAQVDHLFPTQHPNIGPTSLIRIILVALGSELDVVSGAGDVSDLLELKAAGNRHQFSGHFSDQVPFSWGIISVIVKQMNYSFLFLPFREIEGSNI